MNYVDNNKVASVAPVSALRRDDFNLASAGAGDVSPMVGPEMVRALNQGGAVAAGALVKFGAALKSAAVTLGGAGVLAIGAVLMTATPAGTPSAELVRAREDFARALADNFPDLTANRDESGRLVDLVNNVTGVVVMQRNAEGRLDFNPALDPQTLRFRPLTLSSFDHLVNREGAFNAGPGSVDIRFDLSERRESAAGAGRHQPAPATTSGVLQSTGPLTLDETLIALNRDFGWSMRAAAEHSNLEDALQDAAGLTRLAGQAGLETMYFPVQDGAGFSLVAGPWSTGALRALERAGHTSMAAIDRFFDILSTPKAVVDDSGWTLPAPDGASDAEQRNLRMPPPEVVPDIPPHEGFPLGPRPNPDDLIFDNPGDRPDFPPHTGHPREELDPAIGVTIFPNAGDELPVVAAEGEYTRVINRNMDEYRRLRGNLANVIREIREAANVARPVATLKENQNVAKLEYDLEGVTGHLYGASGGRAIQNFVPPVAAGQEVIPALYNNRAADTEYKLLNWLAQNLNENMDGAQTRGRIVLYSQYTVCESCANVILEFKRMFPLIDVVVIAGPNQRRPENISDPLPGQGTRGH